MSIYNYWFLLALALMALEMATGTFYMLIVSVAMVVAGTAALMGLSIVLQFIFCAIIVIGGTFALRLWRKTRVEDADNASLDIGQPVQVLSWHEDGTARVIYRGAEWDAEPEFGDLSHNGTFYIKQMHGSILVLTQRKP
jgi:membrane protein implicated in regulation of membrane protease activity